MIMSRTYRNSLVNRVPELDSFSPPERLPQPLRSLAMLLNVHMGVNIPGGAKRRMPKHPCTTLICVPDMMSADAALCLSVCRVTPLNPARSVIRAKALSAFLGSMGVPMWVVNTKSSCSGQGAHTAAASRSAASVDRCRVSVSTTGEGKETNRRDRSVFGAHIPRGQVYVTPVERHRLTATHASAEH